MSDTCNFLKNCLQTAFINVSWFTVYMVKINLTFQVFLNVYMCMYVGVRGCVYTFFSLIHTHVCVHTHIFSLFQFVKKWYWLDHMLPLFSQNAAAASQINKIIVERQWGPFCWEELISFSPVVSARDRAKRQSELKWRSGHCSGSW